MNKIMMNTPIGKIQLIEKNNKLFRITFGTDSYFDVKYEETDFLKEVSKQINEYFSGKRIKFDIPLLLEGTNFQLLVWNELSKIPYGEVRSYQEIAIMIKNPNASRAVGNANNHNPIPIIIPCHRVIGKNKKLVGYAGGLDKKEYLISLERDNN